MKNEVYFGIVWRIVLLFSFAILGTFISDMPQMRTFFGDIPKERTPFSIELDDYWDWGVRHHWYFWMMLILFLVSVVNVIVGIDALIKKYYP